MAETPTALPALPTKDSLLKTLGTLEAEAIKNAGGTPNPFLWCSRNTHPLRDQLKVGAVTKELVAAVGALKYTPNK